LTSGENKKGYRIWPIYGRKEEVGVSKQAFLLWPIFVKRTKGLDTDDPMDEWMIFPFYISKESKYFSSTTILWPLFSHAKEERTGFEQWDLPWPLFRTFKGENLDGKRFFIFYGYKVREGQSKRVFIVYPFYRYEEDWLPDLHETVYSIFFSRIYAGEDSQGKEKGESVRIWPIYDYDKEEGGRESLHVFYLFPFKDEGPKGISSPCFESTARKRILWEGSPSISFGDCIKRWKKRHLTIGR
jgi:hypothetical protein